MKTGFKSSSQQNNQKKYLFLPFALAPRRCKSSQQISLMSKYWHQTPHWIKLITNIPSLYLSFAPWLVYILFPKPGQKHFFFWMDRFFIKYFPPILFGREHLNCYHLSADDDCCWLLLVPVFPRCFCLNVRAGITQDPVRPGLKWGQTVKKSCAGVLGDLHATPGSAKVSLFASKHNSQCVFLV